MTMSLRALRWRNRSTAKVNWVEDAMTASFMCLYGFLFFLMDTGMMFFESGVCQLLFLSLVPIFAGVRYVLQLVQQARLVDDVEAGGHSPPAPPILAYSSSGLTESASSFATLHPVYFLALDFGIAFVIGIFFLFLQDMSEAFRRLRLDVNRRRQQRLAGRYRRLADVEAGVASAEALKEEFGRVTDQVEELEINLRVHRRSISASYEQRKDLLKKLTARQEELRALLPEANMALAAPADKQSGSENGTSPWQRMCKSVLMQSLLRSMTGIMAVFLYYADVYSDIQVLLLLNDTGNYVYAALGMALLIAQFIVVYMRVLPYLSMTFGTTSCQHRSFLVLGFPTGVLALDVLMFLEPFGLLIVLPERFREFVPAYKATRIIAEVMIESLPQCLLQSYIYVIVLHHQRLGTASAEESAMLEFVSLLPKSILISTIAVLKTWLELVHGARQAGLSVRSKAVQLWQVGAGLPLDALKKDTIVEFNCPYELDDAEISPLLDALGKNSSLTHLDLSGSGLTWGGAAAKGTALIEQMASSAAALGGLRTLVINATSGYQIPVRQLRMGAQSALAALEQPSFFGGDGCPRRDEILFMGDLLRKGGASGASEADTVTKILAAARVGKVQRIAWEAQLKQLMVVGTMRRGQLIALISAEALRDVGFRADELRAVGFSLAKLKQGSFTAKELREIDIGAAELRAEGYTAGELRNGGYPAAALKAAEYPIRELREGGYIAKQLKAVGYSAQELKESGYSARSLRDADCSARQLKQLAFSSSQLREAGFSASQLREASFTLDELKSGGYSATELRECGYYASDMHSAGFASPEMRAAGYSGTEMRGAGYTATEMRLASFSAKKLRAVGYTASELLEAGWTVEVLKGAAYDASQLREGKCSAEQLKAVGFSLPELRSGGYTAGELQEVGYGAEELRAAGASLADLHVSGASVAELRNAGISAIGLRSEGVSIQEMKKAGYTARELLAAGFSPAELHSAQFKAQQLTAVGLTAKELRDGGYTTAQELRAAGCTVSELREGGFQARELRKGGFSAEELVAGGYHPRELKQGGFPATELRHADVGPAELKAAGYTALALKNAQLGVVELRRAGFSAKDLHAEGKGFSASELKNAGFSAKQMRQASVPLDQLQPGDFTLHELVSAGFDASQLRVFGASATELERCGFSASQLRSAGFPVAQLRSTFRTAELLQGGYGVAELREAGANVKDMIHEVTVKELRLGGFSAEQLREAGCEVAELRKGGFTAKDMSSAGFAARDLGFAGFSGAQLKAAGFSARQMKESGVHVSSHFALADLRAEQFSAKELRDEGFVLRDLKKVGCDVPELLEAGFKASELKQVQHHPQPPPLPPLTPPLLPHHHHRHHHPSGTFSFTCLSSNHPSWMHTLLNLLSTHHPSWVGTFSITCLSSVLPTSLCAHTTTSSAHHPLRLPAPPPRTTNSFGRHPHPGHSRHHSP